MTEEIIIDGVNVVECGAYKDKHCKDKTSIIFCDTNLCSNYPYCYYKQLKRLEQENKELRKANEISIEKVTVTAEAKRLQELEQENKRLKDNNNHLQAIIDDGRAENKRFREENKQMKERFEKRGELMCNCAKQRENYRSALEEIKHILEIHKDELEECLHNDIDGMIQNKINEVLS